MQKRNKLPFTVPIMKGWGEDGKGGRATKWPVLVQTECHVLIILKLHPVRDLAIDRKSVV